MSVFDQFLNLHLIRPQLLWLLLPVLVSAYVLGKNQALFRSSLPDILPAHLAHALTLKAKRASYWTPMLWVHLALILLVLAASGPSWERKAQSLLEDEAGLLIALDVSASMAQQDVQPSRLERAKHKIKDLLKLRKGAHTGLLVYAGSAHRVIPLSDDQSVLLNFLDAIDHSIVPTEGRNLTSALVLASSMLNEAVNGVAAVPGSLLLLSDGASPHDVDGIESWAAANPQQQLLVYGIASNPEPEAWQALKGLADKADGYFQTLSVDKRDVIALQWRVNNSLRAGSSDKRPWSDKASYLLYLFLPLFLLGCRRSWHVFAPLLLLVMLQFPQTVMAQESQDDASSWHVLDLLLTRDQQGAYFFWRGDYQEASRRFDDAMWRGTALYLIEDFDGAAQQFSLRDDSVALFNVANSLAHGQRYIKALAAYDSLLKLEPDHALALTNRRVVQTLVDEINAMSESQASEDGEAAFELGDKAQRGDGAERNDTAIVQQQLSADELLTDQRIREQWMQQVQPNPARFLAAKFYMQQEQEGSDAP